jgi:hypothetical protein
MDARTKMISPLTKACTLRIGEKLRLSLTPITVRELRARIERIIFPEAVLINFMKQMASNKNDF